MYQKMLILNPGEGFGQLEIGQIYEDTGQSDKALAHYIELLALGGKSNEDMAILEMKIDKLSGKTHDVSLHLPPYNPSFTMVLIPLEPSIVNLSDMCLLLSSKYLANCEVEEPKPIDIQKHYDRDREQLETEGLIGEMLSAYGDQFPKNKMIIGIVNKDIYYEGVRSVYSSNWNYVRIGVVSTYNLNDIMPKIREKDFVLSRRIGVQLMSSTGQHLGMTRPTKPQCPTAFPNTLQELTQKTTRFCMEEQEQVDKMISAIPDRTEFSAEQFAAIENVYEKYYFE
jgi:predicted Zn-dependent protease